LTKKKDWLGWIWSSFLWHVTRIVESFNIEITIILVSPNSKINLSFMARDDPFVGLGMAKKERG